MLKFLRSTLIIPLALLPLLSSTSPTQAQERQGCFMINASGQLVELGEICPSEGALGTGDIQVTLRWATADDLDLAVFDPSGAQVWYQSRRVASGGELDVDANAGCQASTSVPVENVYWPTTRAPSGGYTIEVNLFERCGGTSGPIPFTLTLLNKGNTETMQGEVEDSDIPIEFPFSVSSQSASQDNALGGSR